MGTAYQTRGSCLQGSHHSGPAPILLPTFLVSWILLEVQVVREIRSTEEGEEWLGFSEDYQYPQWTLLCLGPLLRMLNACPAAWPQPGPFGMFSPEQIIL